MNLYRGPEHVLFRKTEREEHREKDKAGLENLKEFLRQIAERLKREGAPVGENCRINMDEFRDIYGAQEVERDEQKIERIELKIGCHNEAAPDKRLGEQMEMLKTGIFNKFLSPSFVTVRASRFDDIINGIDNVIIDIRNGRVICALDEVAELHDEEFEKKKYQVLNINNGGGAILKYALTVQEGKIKPCGALKNVPIFCLALPPSFVRKGVQSFVSMTDEQSSSYEEKIFEYLIGLMDNQVGLMALPPKANERLRQWIKAFRQATNAPVGKSGDSRKI